MTTLEFGIMFEPKDQPRLTGYWPRFPMFVLGEVVVSINDAKALPANRVKPANDPRYE